MIRVRTIIWKFQRNRVRPLIGPCYIEKCWKLYILRGFSQKNLKFSKKPIFSLFAKKGQNRVFGQFWPQIWKEHQKLGGDGEFGLTKTFFSENIQEIKFFNFFRKKVITQKNEFCNYSAPLFILAYPTSEKT